LGWKANRDTPNFFRGGEEPDLCCKQGGDQNLSRRQQRNGPKRHKLSGVLGNYGEIGKSCTNSGIRDTISEKITDKKITKKILLYSIRGRAGWGPKQILQLKLARGGETPQASHSPQNPGARVLWGTLGHFYTRGIDWPVELLKSRGGPLSALGGVQFKFRYFLPISGGPANNREQARPLDLFAAGKRENYFSPGLAGMGHQDHASLRKPTRVAGVSRRMHQRCLGSGEGRGTVTDRSRELKAERTSRGGSEERKVRCTGQGELGAKKKRAKGGTIGPLNRAGGVTASSLEKIGIPRGNRYCVFGGPRRGPWPRPSN